MQNFIDTKTQQLYAFEDDVVASVSNGAYSFHTQDGAALNVPATLQPHTIPAPTAAQLLAVAQAAQISTLSAACQATIVSGFSSSALGVAHTYPAQMSDQQNLSASVLASLLPNLPAGWTTPFWCADGSGVWSYANHTAAQIQQVGRDAKAAIVAAIQKKAGLVAQVNAATSAAAVQAIGW